MRRRLLLKTLCVSAASPMVVSSPVAAEEGMHPIRGELPNEKAPHESVHAFPEEEATREVGQFLKLQNGWVFPECNRDEQIEFFGKTRQTFDYDGQTFVLDSFEDWKPYEVEGDDDRFVFTHTDPPKPKGETFKLTWDTVYTADFDKPCVDAPYEEDDRHAGFPFESSYEVVNNNENKR